MTSLLAYLSFVLFFRAFAVNEPHWAWDRYSEGNCEDITLMCIYIYMVGLAHFGMWNDGGQRVCSFQPRIPVKTCSCC